MAAQWLTDCGINLSRPIRSLTSQELLGIRGGHRDVQDLRAERTQQLAGQPDGLLLEPAI
jgi:hypothetical protein